MMLGPVWLTPGALEDLTLRELTDIFDWMVRQLGGEDGPRGWL